MPSVNFFTRLIMITGIGMLLGMFVLAILAEWKLSSLAVGGLGEQFSTTIYGKSRLDGQRIELASISGEHRLKRDPINWEDIPTPLINAVVAIEDHSFFDHHGLSFRGLARAALENMKKGKIVQGGSTLTQQLAKNYFLSTRKTLLRKFLEIGFALYLDARLSKEKILTLYLNHIYWGQQGTISICGLFAAARHYFDKTPQQLSLAESALLAGIIRSPHHYNPFVNPRASIARRNVVLYRMKQLQLITSADYRKARQAPLILNSYRSQEPSSKGNEYVVSEIIRQLTPIYGERLFRDGLKIYTTCDPQLQKIAERQLINGTHQAALVTLDPETGAILSLVGGRNYSESQFNRATQAWRQPGSAFKPFVYASALQNGFTAASLIEDSPISINYKGENWTPKNADGHSYGRVSVREALSQSMNLATVRLGQKIGLKTIAKFSSQVGFSEMDELKPSLVLGSEEKTLLQLTAGYAPFQNGGYRVTPYLIEMVQDASGDIIELNTPQRRQIMSPQLAYIMTSLLQSVFSHGTAKSAITMGWSAPSAGKTGTSNNGKDAWFIGYTSELLTGVWIGNDEAKAISVSGAKDALPVWVAYMKDVMGGKLPLRFIEPPGITHKEIDPLSGYAPVSGCPELYSEVFISGTEPTELCPLHSSGVKGWLKKLFKKRK